MTTSTSLNLAQSDGALSSQQLSLPSGPGALLRGGRRERTDEDKAWYSKQLAVKHSKHWDKVVYEKVAYYASLNPGRLAFPSVPRVAREVLCVRRTVQYALRRLESVGLIECTSRGCGRSTSTYRVVGRLEVRDAQEMRDSQARDAPKVIREGKNKETKTLLSAVAQTLDPVKPEGPKEQEVLPTVFPSQERKQEKAPVPETPKRAERRLGEMLAQTPKRTGGEAQGLKRSGSKTEPLPDAPPTLSEVLELPTPAFKNPAQVGMLYSVARKLDYSLSDAEALRFDAMEHAGKKALLDRLLAKEQEAALRGEVEAPPRKPRQPRADVPIEREAKAERSCTGEHRWSEPASDGFMNCVMCDEEIKP